MIIKLGLNKNGEQLYQKVHKRNGVTTVIQEGILRDIKFAPSIRGKMRENRSSARKFNNRKPSRFRINQHIGSKVIRHEPCLYLRGLTLIAMNRYGLNG